MTLTDLRRALGHPNVAAFLRVIREGETNQSDDAYRMMFGGGLFDVAGGWQHPNVVNRAAGLSSTAAGAYQFLHRTWDGLTRQYPFPDFAPKCQDMGAVALIAGRGALQDVLDGRLSAAIAKCNREWASLPGSPYGQPVLSMARCRAVYAQYGGTEAGAADIPGKVAISEAPNQPTEKRMDPLSLVSLLTGVFSPIIRAKAQKALGGEVGGQLADNLLAVTQQVTGKADPLEAVAVARQQPEMVAKVEQAAADWLAQMGPVLDKVAALEAAAWAAEELSRDAAAKRGQQMAEVGVLRSPQFWIAAFILANVTGVVFTVLYRDTFSSDMQSFVIGAIVGGALTAVISYFFGSSRGSAAKDIVIGELAGRRQ